MSLTERQLVDAEGMEALRSGDRGPGPVDAVLLPALSTAGDSRGGDVEAAAECTVVADVLGVGVVDIEGETVAQTLKQRDLQGVVAEVADVRPPGVGDAAVLRKGNQSLGNRGGGADRRGSLEEGRDRWRRTYCGLHDGYVRRSCGCDQNRLRAGAVEDSAESGKISGIQLVDQ